MQEEEEEEEVEVEYENETSEIVALGGVFLIAAVVSAVVFVSHSASINEPMKAVEPKDPLTFEEYLKNAFYTKGFNGSWWSNSEIQWKDAEGSLVLWNIHTNQTSDLVTQDLLTSFEGKTQFMGFAPNDKSLLLFAKNSESVWRHSFHAEYIIFDSANNKSYPIRPADHPDGTKLRYAAWMPHPELNRIIYVFQNNIQVRQDPLDPTSDMIITTDGIEDEVFNGIPDWVYEEEVLSTNKAHYISAEGSKMAFAQFDDRQVDKFYYTKYGDPADVFGNQYPEEIMLRYPKAGTTNPTLKLMVRDFIDMNKPLLPITPPAEVTAFGEYIYTSAKWISEEKLNIVWMNRVQNKAILSECAEASGDYSCVTVYSQEEANGWIDIFELTYKSTGDEMLQIRPKAVGEEGLSYNHIAKLTSGGSAPLFLTSGYFVVTRVLGWNEGDGKVYFEGTDPEDPTSRHFYVTDDSGDEHLECITCEIRTARDELCRYNSITLSPDQANYVHTCQGPGVPVVMLRDVETHSINFVLEDNADVVANLSIKSIPKRLDLKVEVAGGFFAPVVMFLPEDYDPNEKYPMLVEVYGGPGSQTVSPRFEYSWNAYMVTSRNVIYASIDGRGTGFQSNEFLFANYRNLGSVEIEDQIEVARTLTRQYPFIDPERVGIWGWSYGGYATSMVLEQDADEVFACGLIVAPPTSWLLYDTVYTERYMGLPTLEDNMVGYNRSSVMAGVEKLRGKKFFLNHGVADDNVHYQQSMFFAKALELADIQFVQHSYPDENHGIRGVSRFLYHAMDNFWGDCFGYDTNST